MTNPVRRLWGLRRRLYDILGAPGLMIAAISLLSFGFGLIVLAREYNRPRETGLEALHQVISGWVSLPDHLGRTLVDYVDLWRHSAPDEKAGRLKPNLRLTTRSPLSRVVELELMRLGVEGKSAGWRTLRQVAVTEPRLPDGRLDDLITRARRQADELEKLRIRAVTESLAR